MTEPYRPGPYDEYRGHIDIDCLSLLSPAEREKYRAAKPRPWKPLGEDRIDSSNDRDDSQQSDGSEVPPGE